MSKRVTILGAGESGVGAAMLAKSLGEEVFVSDYGRIAENFENALLNLSINYEQGGHNENHILNSDLIIKSPGIPETAAIMKKIRAAGIPVISEIEYAARHSKAKFVGITGSNGKTTTTLLTYHILKKLGLNVGMAGNVGDSLAKQVIEDRHEYYVLELSSFQLDDMCDFKTDIAVLLNITPDHLDRYEYDFQKYINSKFRISANMGTSDHFLFNGDDPVIEKNLKMVPEDTQKVPVSLKGANGSSAFASEKSLVFELNKSFEIDKEYIPLKGKHNMVNAMMAISVASLLGFEGSEIAEAIQSFENAPHRLEKVGEVKGVEYVNDSKATNVDSVWYALDSMNKPVIWIAGGVDKGNDYTLLNDLVENKVKSLICLGKDNTPLHKAFDGKLDSVLDAGSMHEAIEKAFQIAQNGEVVLLSPACASFDLFKNYMDRGDQFKACISELMEKTVNKSAI